MRAVRAGDRRDEDPPGEGRHEPRLPGGGARRRRADRPPPDKFRSQCQHNCWYFLPWHRWYLYYFEQIARATLTELVAADTFVGRKDIASSWALPYWNYAKPGFDKFPVEFASPNAVGRQAERPLRSEP